MPTGQTTIAVDGRMIYQPQCHGIARVTIELLRSMPAAREREIVVVLAEGATSQFDVDDLAKYARIVHTSSPISRPFDVRHLRQVLRSVDAGVLFAPYHVLAPLGVGVPLVVGVHDCILEADRRLAESWAVRRLYRLNTQRTLAQATAVVTPSRTTAEVLPGYYRGTPPVTVCPNGVNVSAWQTPPQGIADVRERLALPERYLLHVGARRPHKNHRVLIEALTQIDESVSLVLVGARDPRVHDEIDLLARQLGVTDRILTLDSVDDVTLRAVYSGASAFVFPSVAEGFGLPPLEAMAAGVPVVASAIPVLAEVCQTAAQLVSPYDADQWAAAITRVIEDDDLRKTMIDDGHRVAGQMSWDHGATRLYTLLDEIAGASATRRSA